MSSQLKPEAAQGLVGNTSTIGCYNINNTNNFKIREIAKLLKTQALN